MKKITKTILTAILAVMLLITGTWGWIQYQDVRGPGLPVLLYHGVDSHGPKTKYTLDTETFDRQLQWLKDNGWSTVVPADLIQAQWRDNPTRKVMLTFDDGRVDNYEIVFPLLQKYGFRGVFFVITNEIGKEGRVTEENLREMSEKGMEIGSHTISHPYLDTLDKAEVILQLTTSKQVLEGIIGKKVIALAPPGGWFDKATIQLARQEGYGFLFGCEIGLNDITKQPFVYKRIEVLRGMNLEEFQHLLAPADSFFYKLVQSLKFLLHDLVGSARYQKLSHVL